MKDTYNIKIFKPALGFDFESHITHIAVPVITPLKVKGKTHLVNQLLIITSNKDSWSLTEEEKEKRNLFPDKLPQFPLGQSRWNREDIEDFLHSTAKDFNPLTEVFIPIKNTLEKHIEFSNPFDSSLAALWTIGTYIFPVFEAYPYLLLNGTRGSGKTKLLEIMYYLAFNAEITANASPSSVFRLIEANLSTVLIDEGETLSGRERDKELIYLLNAGYKKSGVVTRVNKDTHQIEKFQVYSPKAVAAINPLDSTLQSRFIIVNMIKTGNKDKGNIRVSDRSADWGKLRNSLYRFALICGLDVSEIFEKSEKIQLLNCRNNELWSPLLAIAEYLHYCSPHSNLFESLSALATEKIEDYDTLDDWHLALLQTLHKTVTVKKPYLVGDIKKDMWQFFEDGEEQQRISGKWIGNALKRFGFKRGKRQALGATYIIDSEKVKDLLQRYEVSVDSAEGTANTPHDEADSTSPPPE